MPIGYGQGGQPIERLVDLGMAVDRDDIAKLLAENLRPVGRIFLTGLLAEIGTRDAELAAGEIEPDSAVQRNAVIFAERNKASVGRALGPGIGIAGADIIIPAAKVLPGPDI